MTGNRVIRDVQPSNRPAGRDVLKALTPLEDGLYLEIHGELSEWGSVSLVRLVRRFGTAYGEERVRRVVDSMAVAGEVHLGAFVRTDVDIPDVEVKLPGAPWGCVQW